MFNLTISNIDQNTVDVITYIAKKAGGKVAQNTKEKLTASTDKQKHFESFNQEFDAIISQIKDKHNAVSKHKIK